MLLSFLHDFNYNICDIVCMYRLAVLTPFHINPESTLSWIFVPFFTNISFSNMSLYILGKFRHLPVVENGEVIAMLDIAKCLYDAIARLEKAAEQGSAIAAAVEGVERQLGGNFSGIGVLHYTCYLN